MRKMTKKRVIGTTILGNIVEYYDFGIYAVFAPMIGNVFFPLFGQALEILLSFSVFAIGFLMRPFGGVIFGHIGDKFGRKVALSMSIVGMAIATLTIGLLPSYKSIGIAAPIVLIVVRLFQGLCIGGEGTGSAIFILEHLSKGGVSIAGSIVMASNVVGTLLANIVGLIIVELIGLDEITWRYGFLAGAAIGVIGAYFRSKNSETPVFNEMQNDKRPKKMPIVRVIERKKYAVTLVISIAAAATSISYLIRGFLSTFFSEIMHYPHDQSLYFTFFALILVVVLLPIFGIFSEKIGYVKILLISAISIIVCIYPLFKLISNIEHNIWYVFIGLAGISTLCAAIGAPAYPYAIKSFPPELRYSGVALGWNLGNAIFGGTTPLICTLLTTRISADAPSYYLIFTSSLFIMLNLLLMLMVYQLKNKSNNPL
ncbi:MFS transporter [Alphaproteobacteria bacterium]